MPLPPGYTFTSKGLDYTNYQSSDYAPPSREDIQADKEDYQSSEDVFKQWDFQNEQKLGPQGQPLPEYAIGWKPTGEADFGTGLKGWWNKAVSNVRSSWLQGYQEGLSVTYDAYNKEAGKYEKETAQAKPKDQNQAYWFAAMNATKEMFSQALWGGLEALGKPAQYAEQAIGSTAYAIADTIKGEDINWKRNWEASRVLYSGLFDATVFSEMERRLDAGERGDLAAQQVMIERPWSMWPELVGQVVFDPLNTLSAAGKAGEQVRLAKRAAAKFHEVANPQVAKFLEDVSDASKLDDATAYKKIEELVKSQQALTTAASHAEDISQAGKDLDALSKSYKMASLTRDGKIAHLANESGEILMHIVNNAGPDEALEILWGMVRSTDKDATKAAEGISAMMHFSDPKALFSEAGNNTTVLLSRMTEKYGAEWLNVLEEFKGDRVGLTKELLGRLDSVGEEMFPSVTRMLGAEDAVKNGKYVGEFSDVQKTKALAERAKELPEYVKAATRFHDGAQKVVGPVNKLFVGAYMGWNPGYAFRNFTNNTAQLFIDYGPGVLLGDVNEMWAKAKNLDAGGALKALVEGADTQFAKAEALHGGALQGAFGLGQAGDVVGEAAKVEGATDIKGIVHAVKQAGLKGPAQGLASKFEENAAKRIIAKTYTQTFDRGVKTMVKAVTPDLRAAGFSDDIIKKLPTYILQNDGDATKVINALRQDISTGTIDLFNDISRIDPKYKSMLSDTGKWDEYVKNVLQAPTKEAANTAAKKIFDDLAQAGDFVYSEGRAATDNYDKFVKMAENSGMPETRGQLISLRKTESRKAIQVAEEILNEADNLGSSLGLRVGDMKKARKISEVSGWGNDAAKEADRVSDLAWKLTRDAKGGARPSELWMAYPELFPSTPPQVLDKQTFLDALWKQYDTVTSKVWSGARDTAIENITGYLDDLKTAGAEVPQPWYDAIKTAQEGAAQFDDVMIGRGGKLVSETAMEYGTRSTQIAQMAQKAGIATATEAGVPLDKKVLGVINKYAGVNYKSLEDVPLTVAEEAFARKAGTIDRAALEVEQAELNTKLWRTEGDELKKVQERLRVVDELLNPTDAAHFDDAGELVKPASSQILPPPVDGEAPTIARAIHEQMDGIKEMRGWIMQDIEKSFGKKQVVNKVAESALKNAEKDLTQKLAETRLISSRVAQANRDFTLLNYGEKSYFDVALSYLYPFHFWYGRTYANWLKRIAQNPAILAHYARYKDILGTVHAGMPDWWKWNINTNDLPGVDVENPLYFNLEATLWPLNGLTNVDFNDKSKRVNWWTYTLDYANKFGPSTWTPINMITGLSLYAQGEKEAGEKWMGRAIPQSNVIKAGASLLGVGNMETDPFVKFLQGGLDPYERRRVNRALAAMQQEGMYTDEQIQDAAYSQQGEIWDEAVKRAVRGRAPSQISSFLFGVGFKGRTNQDMEVDNFYSDYSKLWTMRPNLTPEEFREGMDSLKQKYPFADTVLLAGRDDTKRDAGFAYTVMNRIPPGKSSQFAKAAGIDPDLLDKFYADKGQIETWSQADRERFMSGILNMAAVLEIPDDMTRGEWTQAKNAYTGLTNEAKEKFGDDILDLVDGYYQAKTVNRDKADAYLENHPEVEDYLNWRSERIMGSPLLSSYYGGASIIENYERSKMYKKIEDELGSDIFDVISEYNDIKTFGDPGEAKRYYAQHREIRRYYQMKDQLTVEMNRTVAQLEAHLPEGQGVNFREDVDMTSVGAQQFMGAVTEPEQPTYEDFQAQVPERLMRFVQDYYYNGKRLPESAQKQLERVAREMGYPDADTLLQEIGASMYAQR